MKKLLEFFGIIKSVQSALAYRKGLGLIIYEFIEENPLVKVGDIITGVDKEQPVVSDVLVKLKKAGLVKFIRKDRDKRVVRYEITDKIQKIEDNTLL